MMPGLVGAALLAFALSIDDFVISNFTSGTTVTFPLYIFGAAQRGIPVEVYSVATLLFRVTVLAMVFATWQQRRAEKIAEIRPDDEDRAHPPGPGHGPGSPRAALLSAGVRAGSAALGG